jgi:hypothetical protein
LDYFGPFSTSRLSEPLTVPVEMRSKSNRFKSFKFGFLWRLSTLCWTKEQDVHDHTWQDLQDHSILGASPIFLILFFVQYRNLSTGTGIDIAPKA